MTSLALRIADMTMTREALTLVLAAVISYSLIRFVHRLYFHPLSRYPGPKIAAVSDIWYAYHALTGRWPWAVEDVLKKYGDVVRIAPNELVFVTPEALAAYGHHVSDLYGSHEKNLERFTKTQINNHGNDEHGGIIWEWDPARHRRVSKQLAPAFSGRALRAKEPTLHKYVDLFVERMKTFGNSSHGVDISTWTDWLCVDVSADMAYNREMNALKNMKEPPYLTLLSAFNKAVVVIQMSWRFPLLSPLKYIFLLFARPHADIRAHSRSQLEERIRRQGAVEHLDFFEHIIPADREPPKDRKEMRHLEQVAGQLLIAGFEAPKMWLYMMITQLLKNPSTQQVLSKEIRDAFTSYKDITADAAARLPFLTACLQESLRLMPNVLTGMPVVSPGATVDGTFIPKGVVCQSSPFALARSPRNFLYPLEFHPERWLPDEHPLHDTAFCHDNRKGFHPFSQGPRICSGREIAWWQGRIFLAKTIWMFDLELVEGSRVDLDRDLRGWGMYEKPDVRVRFVPRKPEA